jgi:hypothetical protein
MDKSFSLDNALIAFSIFHMISVAIEFLYFRFQLNMDRNLEQRIKKGTNDRKVDLFKIFMVSLCLLAFFGVIGLFLYTQQPCKDA